MSIPKSDSTTVAYYRLNEYEKFRKSFYLQDDKIKNLNDQVQTLVRRLEGAQEKNFNFEYRIIPGLEKEIELLKKDHQLAIKSYDIKILLLEGNLSNQRKEKWTWGIGGLGIGAILTIITLLFSG